MLHIFVGLFVCLFVYRITQFVHLAGIQLTTQHFSKFPFGFLMIRPDLALIDDVTIFEVMLVVGGTSVFCDVISLGSIIFS